MTPIVPPVSISAAATGWAQWIGQIARTVNLLLRGKMNCVTAVTLTPNATSTTLVDERIGAFSAVILTPQTETAAMAAASSLWIVPQSGQAVINHASSAATDMSFLAVIIG